MGMNENPAPPVLAKLYEHQIMAYLFVLGLFDELDEGAVNRGGDANERFQG